MQFGSEQSPNRVSYRTTKSGLLTNYSCLKKSMRSKLKSISILKCTKKISQFYLCDLCHRFPFRVLFSTETEKKTKINKLKIKIQLLKRKHSQRQIGKMQ